MSHLTLDKAKRLFVEYDGSRFYMSRNGVEEQYARMQVPTSVESEWLEELTTAKLEQLSSPGNCRVLSFLVHHADYRHLEKLESVAPLGRFGEKSAFLEEFLKYLHGCVGVYETARLISDCNSLLAEAHALKKRVSADASVSRVQRIIRATEQLRSNL
jgi:hypothetical protein